MSTTLTAARRSLAAKDREAEQARLREEAARLDREEAARRNAEIVQRRAAQAEADMRERVDDGPVITIEYAGKTVTIRPGVDDDGLRLSALHAVDVLMKAVAFKHGMFLRARRQLILAGRDAPKNPSGAWVELLGQSDLLPSQQYGLVKVAR